MNQTTLQLAALAPPLIPDVATLAVLRYFEDDAAKNDSFDHLMRICLRAIRPFFILDPEGEIQVADIPQFNDKTGLRSGRFIRREGAKATATRQWVQCWLLEFLAPYRDLSQDERRAAADRDEFRYIGRRCKLQLCNFFKASKAAKNVRPPHDYLEDQKAGVKLLECIGTARQDAPSSLATHASFEECLVCVSNIFRVLVANREALERLDVMDGLRAVLVNAEYLDLSLRNFNARVIQSIATIRQVSVQAARAYRQKFFDTMARQAGNPAIRAIFLELRIDPPNYTLHIEPENDEIGIPPALTGASTWDDPEEVAQELELVSS